MKYGDITHRIIGCAMKVHSTLGNGFQEVIYQRALAIEMGNEGLSFNREMEMEEAHDRNRLIRIQHGQYLWDAMPQFDYIVAAAHMGPEGAGKGILHVAGSH